MKYFVYIIQNKTNLKVYIGKSKERKTSRFLEHIALSRLKLNKDFSLIHASIAKYGEENFSYQIIEYFDNENESLEAEKFWINYFRSDVNRFGNEYGYNLTSGGDGFTKPHSIETKNKIKNSLKQRLQDPLVKNDLVSKLQEGKKSKPPQFNINCKVDWPSDLDLYEMVKSSSYKAIAKQLGVSNIAVRERLKRRGLYPVKQF